MITLANETEKCSSMANFVQPSNEPFLIDYEDIVSNCHSTNNSTTQSTTATDLFEDLEPSDELFCPISQTIMAEPVLAADGRTYEKELITKWLMEHSCSSPFTREFIGTQTIENVHVKNEIQRFFQTLRGQQMLNPTYSYYKYHLSNDVFLPCSYLLEFQSAICRNDRSRVRELYESDIRLLLYSPEMLSDSVNYNISFLAKPGTLSNVTLKSYILNGYELCCKMGSLEMIEEMYEFLTSSHLNRPVPPLMNETETALDREVLNKRLWGELKKETIDIPMISKLLTLGAQLHKQDSTGRNALYMFLSCHDNVEVLGLLLSSNTNSFKFVKEKCHPTEYLLYSATKFNRLNAIKLIMETLSEHIDLPLQHGPNNETPLHAAVRNNNEELLSFLLSQPNIGVDAMDNFCRSPFILACKLGFHSIAKLLYQRGAQIDLADSDGETGLHYAASRNWSPIIELLICNGADVNARNKRNQTPYQVASYETTRNLILFLTGKQLSYAFSRVKKVEEENSFLKTQLELLMDRVTKLEKQ